MDEDEDDVVQEGLQCWPIPHRQLKQTGRGSHTGGRTLAPSNGMLPCQRHEDHRRLFNGNGGLLLLAPPIHSPPLDIEFREILQPMDPPPPRPVQSVEALIGQKLQLIGDQFYQEHMMRHRNQRAQHPLWGRVVVAIQALLFGRGAGGRRDDHR